jgi:hypothetical protein
MSVALLTLATAGSSTLAGNINLDTTSAWNGTDAMDAFGVPNTSTYGQTFIAPAGAGALENFTFFINTTTGSHLLARPFVMRWTGGLYGGDGGTAVGPTLHLGSPITLDPTGGFEEVLIDVGGVPVTPGNAYVLGLTISDPADYNASTGKSVWGIIANHVSGVKSGGGGFVFFNNLDQIGELETVDWDHFIDLGDLAFKATFSPSVPDAGSSLAFLALGLFGLTFATRRATRA